MTDIRMKSYQKTIEVAVHSIKGLKSELLDTICG
jgi:hypothetical protein